MEELRGRASLKERVEHLEAMSGITRILLRDDPPRELALSVLKRLRDLLGCEMGGLVLLETEGKASLMTVDWEGEGKPEEGLVLPLSELCGGGCEVEGKTVALEVNRLDPSALLPSLLKKGGFQVLLKAPLEQEGGLMGFLMLGRRGREAFTLQEQALAKEAADVLSIGLQRALFKEELETYKEIFKGIPVGLFRADREGVIVHANPAFVRMVGHRGEELEGRKVAEFFADPGDYERWRGELEGKGTVQGFEARWRTLRGDEIWVRGNAQLLSKAEGVYVEGYFNDITSLKEAESERAKLQQELLRAHKLELLGRMAGGVAHDFNNIVTIIKGFTDLLSLRVPADSPLRGPLQHIGAAVEKAATLTRKLLAFSRRQTLEMSWTDLNELMSNMEVFLKRALGEDVDLVLDLNPVRPVWGDPVQIEQVVMNLAINARDAMPEGGRLLIRTEEVLVEGDVAQNKGVAPGPFVCITVSDDGVGMDEETLQQIFDPFFTTKEEGTGLGLSVVYGIVKQHKGFIDVQSAPGRGTTFRVFLPTGQQS